LHISLIPTFYHCSSTSTSTSLSTDHIYSILRIHRLPSLALPLAPAVYSFKFFPSLHLPHLPPQLPRTWERASTSTMIHNHPASCWVFFLPSFSLLFSKSKYTHCAPLPKITSNMTVEADKSPVLATGDTTSRSAERDRHDECDYRDAAVGSIWAIEDLAVNSISLSLFD
jgi:hypothetical protein